jgi:hypothetical protein
MTRRKCQRTGKIRHRDEIAAKIALGTVRARPLRDKCEQRVYRCKFCHDWHLTSQDRRTDQA